MAKIKQVISSVLSFLFVRPKSLFSPGSKNNVALPIKAVLFDLDGLLVDTETICSEVVVDVMEKFGIKISKLEAEKSCGITAKEFYIDLLKERSLRMDVEDILQVHNTIYERAVKEKLTPFPGATTLPGRLKAAGYKIGLVSGSTKKQIELILNKLNIINYFDVIISADDVINGKPSPEGFLKAANILDVEPNECMVLEESFNGIRAGKAAGMLVIGVVNLGTQDISGADMQIYNLTEFDVSEVVIK